MHILDKIVAHKRTEVERNRELVSIAALESSPYFNRGGNAFAQTLGSDGQSGVIAEFKRKSPSKQNINLSALIGDVAPAYVQGGAGAISILTDEDFFGGRDGFLTEARGLLPTTPLLRKEFIIDEYQVIEAKSLGADIILLIAEILTQQEVAHFAKLARSLDMEVLLELHSDTQLCKYSDHVSIVGVNNRDLTTFEVDYDRSKQLFDQLPGDVPKISESGLGDPETLVMLYEYGFKGFLIGEQFMKNEDPGLECELFISRYMKGRGRKHIDKLSI